MRKDIVPLSGGLDGIRRDGGTLGFWHDGLQLYFQMLGLEVVPQEESNGRFIAGCGGDGDEDAVEGDKGIVLGLLLLLQEGILGACSEERAEEREEQQGKDDAHRVDDTAPCSTVR